MNKIYCFMENSDHVEFNKFISQYEDDKEVNMYSSIFELSQNQLSVCYIEMMSIYTNSSEAEWFVTDVHELYDIAQQLFSLMFEKIIYIDTDNHKEFNQRLRVEELVGYDKQVAESEDASTIIDCMWKLRGISEIELINELGQIMDNLIQMDDWSHKAFWVHVFEVFIYGESDKTYSYTFEYSSFIRSVLLHLDYNAKYTNEYLQYILNGHLDNDQLYFIWNQFKRIRLNDLAEFDTTSNDLMNDIYEQAYKLSCNKLREEMCKIPSEDRREDLVMISTIQFLTADHAPTRTVIERAKTLKKLGKQVVIVNTTEQCSCVGCTAFYYMYQGTVFDEFHNVNMFDCDGISIPFIQLSKTGTISEHYREMHKYIQEYKPMYILSIGTGSMAADICGHDIPCAAMSLAFSTLPKSYNPMRILGRKLTDDEKKSHADDDIIESTFTFELKEQKKILTRIKLNIPEDKFVIVIVGIRLDFELADDFMKVLDGVSRRGCHVVFAGTFDTYEKRMESYADLKEHSNFIGYCDDILALMEICDLYVNPVRVGGGFSVIEAFVKGVPGVYVKTGDVYTAGGDEFAVDSLEEMEETIIKYKDDEKFYDEMAAKGKERAAYMTSSDAAISDIDRQIRQRIEEKYW